jgi:CheY-like chemotaxis protein
VTARVLVVDDSSVVRELIAVNLELEGLEVVRCVDGVEALERVAEQRPDAITLDVMMPRLDGFAVVERLRGDRSTADIPIVIVTGRASAADLARGEALGVDAYLTKPFEPSELLAAVLRLVDQPH